MKPNIFTTLFVSCGLLGFSGHNLYAQETDGKCDLSFDQGKLTFQSRNKAFKLKLDNRIYTDLSFYLPTESEQRSKHKAGTVCHQSHHV